MLFKQELNFSKQDIDIIKKIYNILTKQKMVSIFVHENPDFDALSSALALMDYLIEKKIDARIVGVETIDEKLFEKIYEKVECKNCNDEFIKSSTGIILDTANRERVLSQKHVLAKQLLRIDHHPKIQDIANYEWVNHEMSSTCEMVAWFLYLNDEKKGLNTRRCNFLYCGIITDTGRFMFNLAKKSTFVLMSLFFDKNFAKEQVQEKLNARQWLNVKLDSKILNSTKTKNNIGWIIINKQQSKKLQKVFGNDLSKSYLLNDIKQFNIWMSVYYQPENDMWKVSLRSRHYNVKKIASNYGGGGHYCAAGVKFKTLKEVKHLINELIAINWENNDLKINEN